VLLVAAVLLTASVAQADPQTLTVFAGPTGSAYEASLAQLITSISAELPRGVEPRFEPTAGSQENLLRLRSTPASIGLIQGDVLAHAGDDGDPGVVVLARVQSEAIWIAAPIGTQSLDQLSRLQLGPSTGGGAFTFHRLADAWTGLPLITGELGWSGAAVPGRGRFDVSETAPWTAEELERDGLEWMSPGAGRIHRAVLADPSYTQKEVTLPGGRAIQTLGVDAMLVAHPSLRPAIAEAIVQRLLADEGLTTESFLRPDEGPVAGRFFDLDSPEHPSLIHLKRGPHPYLDFILVFAVLLLLFVGSSVLWARGTWERRARRRGESAPSARRLAGLVTLLFAVLSWTLFSALAIKAVELGPMLAGSEDASALWRMNLGAILSWLFVLVSIGYEADVFPVTTLGKILAASVQMVGWGGALFILSNLFLGAVERLLKRYLNRGVDMDLSGHLVICNWTPEAEVILREVRKGERLVHDRGAVRVVVVATEEPEGLAEAFTGLDIVVGDVRQASTLRRAQVAEASAIIVLRSADSAITSDAATATTCLAIRGLEREAGQSARPLYAEVLDPASGRDMQRLGVGDVGAEGAFQLDLLAETAVSPRVSLFYEDLLRFEDDSVELYSVPAPALDATGPVSFGSLASSLYGASLAADSDNPAVLVGVQPDGPGGQLLLNPRGDAATFSTLSPDAHLLVLAWNRPNVPAPLSLGAERADDASQTGEALRPAQTDVTIDGQRLDLGQGLRDHIVICNWDENGADLLDRIRCTGLMNPIVVVTDQPVHFENSSAFAAVSVIPMRPLEPGALERVDLGHARAVVVLAGGASDEPDSSTLLLVLRLRKLFDELPAELPRPGVSAEVRDPRNVESVRAAGADEAVCAREMLYRVFAQAVFNPAIIPCFRDLLRHSDETCEGYVVKVPRSLLTDHAHFGTVVAWAATPRARAGDNPMVPVGVLFGGERLVVNPRGDERTRRLRREDRLVVLQYSR
jgi:Trk K+ transport system NAD-binding subunit